MAFSKTSFNLLEYERAAEAGRSHSPAKVQAAKHNGKKGGRPCTLTVADRLFGRKLTTEDRACLPQVLEQLFARERQVLESYFGEGDYAFDLTDVTAYNSMLWRKKDRNPRKEIRYILAKLRLAAEHLMPWPTKPPKDYVVVRVPKYEGEQEAWERRYPDMPFVATRPKRIKFEEMTSYRHLDRLLSKNPNRSFTVEDVKESEGSGIAVTDKVAEAVLARLKFMHKSPSQLPVISKRYKLPTE